MREGEGQRQENAWKPPRQTRQRQVESGGGFPLLPEALSSY